MRLENRQQFECVIGRLRALAKIEKRLPQQVFSATLRYSYCFEFELFSDPSFWHLLQNIARYHGDTGIVVSVLDPDPDTYFHKEFGEFGVVELAIGVDADSYFNLLADAPEGWPVDSILQNSEVLTWFGEGTRWLLWGERSVGIAILGTQDLLDVHSLVQSAGIQAFTAAEALATLIPMNFRNERVPEHWQNEFLANYQKQL